VAVRRCGEETVALALPRPQATSGRWVGPVDGEGGRRRRREELCCVTKRKVR
jgi:hypothetical protein